MINIYVGLTAKATITLPLADADNGITVRGRLVNASRIIELSVDYFSGDATVWTMTIPKDVTADYTAGTYTLQLIAIDGIEETIIYSESATIYAATAADLRSHEQKVLDQLNTIIETKSTQDHQSLTINMGGTNQSITRMSWDDILKARNHYQTLVTRALNRASGNGTIRTIKTRFV